MSSSGVHIIFVNGQLNPSSSSERYDTVKDLWIMRHRGKEEFLATSQASKSSLLLGSHVWQVFNDSKSCSSNRVSYRTTLTLHACKSAGQFACGNAFCIDMERRCDGKVDCRDASDEEDCGILLLEPGYNKMLTPAPLDRSSDLLVNISLNLLDILDINELDEVFKVKIAMKREWFDSRLSFKHLKKNDSNRNDLPEAEGESIWYPSVTFNNIEGSDQLKATHVKNTHRIIPNENFSFEHKDNVHLFKGSASKLSLTKQWTVEFICHYDIGVSNKKSTKANKRTKTMTKTNTFTNSIKERSQTLVTFETFDQSYKDT